MSDLANSSMDATCLPRPGSGRAYHGISWNPHLRDLQCARSMVASNGLRPLIFRLVQHLQGRLQPVHAGLLNGRSLFTGQPWHPAVLWRRAPSLSSSPQSRPRHQSHTDLVHFQLGLCQIGKLLDSVASLHLRCCASRKIVVCSVR